MAQGEPIVRFRDVRKAFGPKVIFQDLQDLKDAITEVQPALKDFETSIFDGCYVTGDISDEYLRALESQRNDDAKHTENVANHITRNLVQHI